MSEGSRGLTGGLAFFLMGCASAPADGSSARDEAEARGAITAVMESIDRMVETGDLEGLPDVHLDSPKFTKFGRDPERREDFREMVASEHAGFAMLGQVAKDLTLERRDQRIDVFGDVAVSTSFPVIGGTLPDGQHLEIRLRETSVWVETEDGWKIAHEHNTQVPDLVKGRDFLAEAAVRNLMLGLDDLVNAGDFDGLTEGHLQSPKFSKLVANHGREDFDAMMAHELSILTTVSDFSIDFHDLKIDVFGPVAIASSPALYSWTEASGERNERELLATMIWVLTPDGWKIAHEHNSPAVLE